MICLESEQQHWQDLVALFVPHSPTKFVINNGL
jgi:hypothetical protein